MMQKQSFGADDSPQIKPEEVVAKYAALVYRLALARTGQKCDAEDVFQEVFLRYIRKAPHFETAAHEKAWLIRVTLNCSSRFHTSSFRKHTQPLEEAEDTPQEKTESALEEYLWRLPQHYRTVLHLFYYEDLSIRAIAGLTGKKESTVRMQLTRARRLLKQYMEGDGFHA